ncbi:hypothetical protein BDP55DRAFT_627683 [Colletotrichum godetiae]|uniref:Uncharacterized protein n=1 Tax=Colletotrichum godetiae TaxID=1209918 RepID=A0AAJ0AXU9_9PEZI|nr:uncharacterized protein BDP55DRAFT_627683 [Colletotrichum godetiae]KAK1691006.1 hypothetical protein BDP55DRAFT_627683 [Colletotrichum godetiae]
MLDWLALPISTLGFRGGWHRPPIESPVQGGFWLKSSFGRLKAFASASQAHQADRNACSFSQYCLAVLNMDLVAIRTPRYGVLWDPIARLEQLPGFRGCGSNALMVHGNGLKLLDPPAIRIQEQRPPRRYGKKRRWRGGFLVLASGSRPQQQSGIAALPPECILRP